MKQFVPKALAMILFLIVLVEAVAGQSTDRDNPTKLTKPEISGLVDGKNARSCYYSLTVGPGEFVITLDVKGVGDHTSIGYELFDQDARLIDNGSVGAVKGGEERKVGRLNFDRKTTLIIRLQPATIWGQRESGAFRVRLSGAVDFDGASSPTCLPKQGTLRVKMKDGTIKEIDLKQADEIKIQP